MAFSQNTIATNTGFNTLTVRNNSADYYEIYRQFIGEAAAKIGSPAVPDSPIDPAIFNDYNAKNGVVANYWAEAFTGAGVSLGISDTRIALQSFGGIYLHKVARAVTGTLSGDLMHLVNLEGSSREISVAANIIQLPAYDKPVIETGTTVKRIWRIPLKIVSLTDGTREILNGWIRAHDVLCCRDDRGRRMFGVLRKVKESLDLSGDYPFELYECDYRENITW